MILKECLRKGDTPRLIRRSIATGFTKASISSSRVPVRADLMRLYQATYKHSTGTLRVPALYPRPIGRGFTAILLTEIQYTLGYQDLTIEINSVTQERSPTVYAESSNGNQITFLSHSYWRQVMFLDYTDKLICL